MERLHDLIDVIYAALAKGLTDLEYIKIIFAFVFSVDFASIQVGLMVLMTLKSTQLSYKA